MKKILLLLLGIASSAMADPGKITGRVMDESTGQGLSGIIVTNGAESIHTDKNGKYELPYHTSSRFVSVVMPADRDAPAFYQRIKPEHRNKTYDFKLNHRPVFKTFRFIQISDTEDERNAGIPLIFNNIRDFTRSCGAAFLLHTGDIHQPEDQKYHAEYFNRGNFGVRAYHVLGNHDHKSAGRGEKCFEDTLGPISYAFEEGNVIFVILPMYGIYDRKPGFTKSDVDKFFFHIMNLIPKEKPLVIVSHYPESLSADGLAAANTPYQVDLKQWNVKGWIFGHTHYNRIIQLPCGIKLFNTTITTKGGDAAEPAAYRYYHVAEDGSLTSRIIPTLISGKLDIRVSPLPSDDESRTITAAYADSAGFAAGIEVAVTDEQGKSERIALTQSTPLAWCGKYHFKPGIKYTIQAVARLNSGNSVKQETVFPSPVANTQKLELERIVCLPAQPLLGTAASGNGMVFIGTCDNENGINHYICALDAETGKLRWKYRTMAGVRNSVVYCGNTVYAADADSNAYALSAADGRLLWKSVDPLTALKLNASAPLLHNGILYCGAGTCLRALDAETGKVLWKNNNFEAWDTSISSPVIINNMLILSRPGPKNPIRALDLKSGKLLWETPIRKHLTRPTVTPLPDGNLLLVARYFSAVIDSRTGKIIQTFQSKRDEYLERGTASMPLVADSKVYVGTEWRGLAAFDLHNLKHCWNSVEKAGIPKNSLVATAAYRTSSRCVDTSPIKIGNHLLFAGLDGNLYECAIDNGMQTGKIEIGMPVIATPGIAGSRLYLSDYAGRMFIFKIKNPSH